MQRLADQVTAWFVPAVVAVAVLAFAVWTLAGSFSSGLLAFIAVLVISCPCALGIATPAALMVGVGKGAELGILIRSGEALERVERLTTVVFDKTGTLTMGKPVLTEVVASGRNTKAWVLQLAASLEYGSEHPLAAALLEAAADQGLELLATAQFRAQVGEGVQAVVAGQEMWLGNRSLALRFAPQLAESLQLSIQQLETAGNTVMLLGQGETVHGLIAVADSLRPEARQAVQLLQRRRIRVVMLSGDNRATAEAIAAQVGITEVIAEVRPADKAATIRALQQAGQVVAMVGDGVNDAPALAAADVGMAMGNGTDVAMHAAGITLMRGDVALVGAALEISARTVAKIRQNLFWAFAYNVAGIPLAALGYLNPMMAGAAMALSSVSVMANALLLKRWKP